MPTYRLNSLCAKLAVWFAAMCLALEICGCGSASPGVPVSTPGTGGSAQPRVVSAPVLGYAWDSTAQILRQIDGVPGAARVDASGDTGQGFAMALAARDHDYALLLDAKGALYLATLPGGVPRQISAGPWSGIAISPSGVYAVVFAASGAPPQLIGGLPQQPVFHALDAQGLHVAAAAVGDDGASLLAVDVTGGVTILAVPVGGRATRAMTVGAVGGMAFVPGSDRALVADALSGTVTLISGVNGVPMEGQVSGAKLSGIVGLDVSADGQWAVAANGAGAVTRMDLSGQGLPVMVKCGCKPGTVTNLSGSAFLLTDAGSATGWMVDAGGASPRVLFIPALPVQKSAGGAQ